MSIGTTLRSATGGGGTLSIVGPFTPQGRLTLTTGVPVLTSSVTAATTVYYTPDSGDLMPSWDGSNWSLSAIGELSQLTTDNTKSPAACANNSNYDVFVWLDGSTFRATRGPAWTSDTARGTGAGTTELQRVSGIMMNKNSITNGPAANRGVYVGSFRTNGSAQVDMIFGGVGAAGGESTILGVWNMFNRRFGLFVNFDNTSTWNYTTVALRIKNGSTANRINFIIGLQEDGIYCVNSTNSKNPTIGVFAGGYVGLNSDTAQAATSTVGISRAELANAVESAVATYATVAPLGFNYVAPLESSTASGTTTWSGSLSNGTTTFVMSAMF